MTIPTDNIGPLAGTAKLGIYVRDESSACRLFQWMEHPLANGAIPEICGCGCGLPIAYCAHLHPDQILFVTKVGTHLLSAPWATRPGPDWPRWPEPGTTDPPPTAGTTPGGL